MCEGGKDPDWDQTGPDLHLRDMLRAERYSRDQPVYVYIYMRIYVYIYIYTHIFEQCVQQDSAASSEDAERTRLQQEAGLMPSL